MNYKVWLVAAGILLAVLAYWYQDQKADSPPAASSRAESAQSGVDKDQGLPVVGSMAPNFAIASPDGKSVRLYDYRNKVVLLNFWATWCEECKKEMPALEKFYHAHQDEGFVVIAVNVMQRDNQESIVTYTKNMGLTFPVGLDAARTVGQKYRVQFLPTSYLIDKQGIIAAVKVGPLSENELEAYWAKMKGQ